MSRIRRIEHSSRFFFVTTNLERHVPHLTPTERTLILECLGKTKEQHGFALFAYVVMPDHAHLLLTANESALPDVMRHWKGQCGFALARRRCAKGPVWQARYFDFILRRVADFWDKLDYIHKNPVRAGLAANLEDWPWSSFPFYSKRGHTILVPDQIQLPLDHNSALWPAPWLSS